MKLRAIRLPVLSCAVLLLGAASCGSASDVTTEIPAASELLAEPEQVSDPAPEDDEASLAGDGVWDGERILPEGWVDYARTPSSTDVGYGSGFWLDWYGEGTVSAEGFQGQKIVLVPDEDMIVVVLASNDDGDDSAALVSDLIDAITGGQA